MEKRNFAAYFLKELINEAYKKNASDIHFQPRENDVQIYFRIGTNLVPQKTIDLIEHTKIMRHLKFKTRLDIANTTKPQDGSYSILTDDNEKLFLRVSTLPGVKFESGVIRLLTNKDYDLDDLSLIPKDISKMYDVINNNNGVFIFTGPTGSGKTTTINSILDKLAKENKKVITIENPAEIINENLVQLDISNNLNISFSDAMKYVLRQKPDVVMVSNTTDEDTARSVFSAALSGCTVITTMNTKNKQEVIERLEDFGFSKSEIQNTLIGVSNQRLVMDNNKKTKSFYDFSIGEDLQKLIDHEKYEDIHEKIDSLLITKKNKKRL